MNKDKIIHAIAIVIVALLIFGAMCLLTFTGCKLYGKPFDLKYAFPFVVFIGLNKLFPFRINK